MKTNQDYIEEYERHYRVRYRGNGRLLQKYFNFEKYRSKQDAFRAAIKYRDKIVRKTVTDIPYAKDEFMKWISQFILENDINSSLLSKKQILEEIKANFPEV